MNFHDPKLKYDQQRYQYLYNGKPMQSVSKILTRYDTFDADAVATSLAQRRGISPAEVKAEWEQRRTLGIRVHEIAEELIGQGTAFVKNETEQQYKETLQCFLADHPEMYWDETELAVCDPDVSIAGRLDALYSTVDGYSILDWKICNNIYRGNGKNKKMRAPLDHLDSCNYNKYTLELSLFRYIVESQWDVVINNQVIVWVQLDNYEIFKLPYLYDEVFNILP